MPTITSLEDIKLGSTVFTKGLAFDQDDLGVSASKQSRKDSSSGRGKHVGIVIGKTETGLLLAATSTFNGSTTLATSVSEESLPYWIPVDPATKESTHDVVSRVDEDEKPKWINVRKSHSVDGEEWKVLPENYSSDVVKTIILAIEANAPASTST